ncbi:MAG: multifunctional oxoglutarate decarboxylase/oxoglutarate dehydrogenase thiamine pyrophosphate-binding subunit/dihydrolipoyllysine-residue succinyltransferase subunit, partial [Myxococcota bacterium]
VLQQLQISKVMTLTSTYDHRIIQGAESGQFLAHVHALLVGENNFYEDIFACLGMQQAPDKLTANRLQTATTAPTNMLLQSKDSSPLGAGLPDSSEHLLEHLANHIRNEGHLWANINPLQSPSPWPFEQQASGLDSQAQHKLQQLKQAYMGCLAPEFMHIQDEEQRTWWIQQTEQDRTPCTPQQQKSLLKRLIQAENFAHFLHKRFVGHKRFGIEGAESLLVVLDGLLACSQQQGVQQVGVAMPHRGRLNVLAHIFGKPYKELLAEFDSSMQSLNNLPELSGDVKHHMGYQGTYCPPDSLRNLPGTSSKQMKSMKDQQEDSATCLPIRLAHNPSHLEAVYPVVLGMVRAQQDGYGDVSGHHRVLGVVVHGDASFAGQGVVYESLQLSRLSAYNTQGSVHVIVDNQIGYTTSPAQGRSTRHCSDLAHAFGLPVLHVNADDPEACLHAAQLAMQYHKQFSEDVIIHLLAYRRNGHNEADDPSITQPQLYETIDKHPSVTTQYGQRLIEQRVISTKQLQQMKKEHWDSLDQAAKSQNNNTDSTPLQSSGETAQTKQTHTGVAKEILCNLANQLTQIPAGFKLHPRVQAHVLQRRQQMMQTGQQLDFGMTEHLAYASLLAEGTRIRLCGQDSQRGTFAHRHAVLHDVETGNTYMPLQNLQIPPGGLLAKTPDHVESTGHLHNDLAITHEATRDKTPSQQNPLGPQYQCYNSSLSEAAAVGFEYGYSVSNPRALVIWEAQFGDFCNGAQVHIDQFIASGHAKWNQACRLVLMLPHGYEGQGPEHSSARLERFLQLCAQNNMRVATCIKACQLFHLLRNHAHAGRCPLVLLMPKSLLRSPQATCRLSDLTKGSFKPVLSDSLKQIKQAKRLILCSGKVFWQLDALRRQQVKKGTCAHVALVQLQQLYPFPHNTVKDILQQCMAKEIVWLQEEPANMGAYNFCTPLLQALLKPNQRLRYIGRQSSASPATGYACVHKQEQDQLLQAALAQIQPGAKNVYA